MLRTPAHLYGESIFTSTRSIDGKLVYREQHLERLFEHVKDYYFMGELKQKSFFERFKIEDEIDELLKRYPNHYFRLSVFADERDTLLPATMKLEDLQLDILVKEIKLSQKALKLQTKPSPFTKFKSSLKAGSYFQNFYDKRKSITAGFDDCLYIREGVVTEASTSNIIFGVGDLFFTPQKEEVFYGIGIRSFSEIFKSVSFADIHMRDLSTYDSCYLINSVSLLTPVSQVNENFFTNAKYEFMLEKVLKTLKR